MPPSRYFRLAYVRHVGSASRMRLKHAKLILMDGQTMDNGLKGKRLDELHFSYDLGLIRHISPDSSSSPSVSYHFPAFRHLPSITTHH